MKILATKGGNCFWHQNIYKTSTPFDKVYIPLSFITASINKNLINNINEIQLTTNSGRHRFTPQNNPKAYKTDFVNVTYANKLQKYRYHNTIDFYLSLETITRMTTPLSSPSRGKNSAIKSASKSKVLK